MHYSYNYTTRYLLDSSTSRMNERRRKKYTRPIILFIANITASSYIRPIIHTHV